MNLLLTVSKNVTLVHVSHLVCSQYFFYIFLFFCNIPVLLFLDILLSLLVLISVIFEVTVTYC
jgi:hypothetical protein